MRTGSYLLCEAMEATDCAGHPREVFCSERRADYCGKWQLPKDIGLDDFIRAALQKSTTDNGVCGIKIHWHHLAPLARECGTVGKPWSILPELFPTAKYIHLRRRNRRAQAISYYRALITNEWWRVRGEDNKVPAYEADYDGAEIRRLEIELEGHQRAWDEFFATQPVTVMTMEYESLAHDYRGEIARALTFLGEDSSAAQTIPDPRLVCQSDEVTESWHRRLDLEDPN
jgi:LPS sulfotransferase NodH